MPFPRSNSFTASIPLAPNLLRSAIAKPLLDLVSEDLAIANLLGKSHIKGTKAIFLNRRYPGGVRKAALHLRDALLQLYGEDLLFTVPASRFSKPTNPVTLKMSYDQLDALNTFDFGTVHPIEKVWPRLWHVVIDVNLKYRPQYVEENPDSVRSSIPDPREDAKEKIIAAIKQVTRSQDTHDQPDAEDWEPHVSSQYVFARLNYQMLLALVALDRKRALAEAGSEHSRTPSPLSGEKIGGRLVDKYLAIHQIWPDFEVRTCVYRSLRTVKADAAQNSFSAFGEGVHWAVVDTGVDANHPHFELHGNIIRDGRLSKDFTAPRKPGEPNRALTDKYGHGTHVAGIIAGQQLRPAARRAADSPASIARSAQQRANDVGPYPERARMIAASREYGGMFEDGTIDVKHNLDALDAISGIAPKCKIVSLRVLDDNGQGRASFVLRALEHIQSINNFGRDIKIHGVNLSLGHSFDAEWFACGHSPLCVEVNRMVKSGVVVVVAAGNSGYGLINSTFDSDPLRGSLDMSINDPGNAELAITVGATHRDQPHRYGVSYFSSKGPTGDGRNKPDLLAPGERIMSAAAWGSVLAKKFGEGNETDFSYMEQSGTSQAAPHMSGAVAAFLSIRGEFIGEPERIKRIFTSTATDVGRDRSFQGAGVLDLLRAIQSV